MCANEFYSTVVGQQKKMFRIGCISLCQQLFILCYASKLKKMFYENCSLYVFAEMEKKADLGMTFGV